jgi:hypothetical protein
MAPSVVGMTADESDNRLGTGDPGEKPPTPLSESDLVRKDMSYSPASEDETRRKQEDPLPATIDDDIDTDQILAVPGTGGPDDTGDIEVDPADLNMPWRS